MSSNKLLREIKTSYDSGVFVGDYPTEALVEYILHIAHEKDLEVSPLEVTLTLYRATFDHLRDSGRFLLKEDFEAWHYGPKLRSVQKKYTLSNTFGAINYDVEKDKMMYDKDMLIEALDVDAKRALDRALDLITAFNSSELVSMSVKSNPWKKSFKEGEIAIIKKELIKEEADKLSKTAELKDKADRIESLQFKNKVERIYNNRSTLWVEENISKEHIETKIINSAKRGETSTLVGKVPFNIDEEIVFKHLKEMFPYFEFSLEDTISEGYHIIPRQIKITFIEEPEIYYEVREENKEKGGIFKILSKD